MNIPESYRTALMAVREVFPGALIAGGCLRDLDNGRPVKDVDIFVPNCPSYDDTLALVREHLVPDPQMMSNTMGGYEAWATPELVGVFDICRPDQDFQPVCLSGGPETILGRMDFGICRISYDGESVHRTDEYLADQATKTFTLLRSDDDAQHDRSMRRWDRFREKYGDWTLLDAASVF
jgi:hypothetical protein